MTAKSADIPTANTLERKEELAACFGGRGLCRYIQDETDFCENRAVCRDCIVDWLRQPVKDGDNDG